MASVQQIGVLKAVILTCQKCASHVATIRPPVNATQPECERKRALRSNRAMRIRHVLHEEAPPPAVPCASPQQQY